ncbi:hypothetical protein Poly30_02830 [Planctomycetes bacterium Poly30]|uniref:ATP-dependent zinc metalloprotease FtsH n=1 Tax=Saltatorellus ferox TaxID=2528018 RepID=A0A518EL29_9BACT|nr:hypothetical protein Poly30_02830 [Planctomycetes bacterium Poly30]
MSVPDDEVLAWHEASHAVVAHVLGGRVRLVTLEQDEDALGGMTSIEWPAEMASDRAGFSARVALAGPLAEIERFGEVDPDDVRALAVWELDWSEVERSARTLHDDPVQRESLIRSWVREVRALLEDPHIEERIARVAEALDAHGTLDRDLFEDCLG